MKDEVKLQKRIREVHLQCHLLCKKTLGRYLGASGNVGIFCQSEEEYKHLTKVREKLTKASGNPNQKYYELHEPIVIPTEKGIPEATYTHLYIRRPDPTPYGKNPGDIDFVVEDGEYLRLKSLVESGKVNGAKMYDRPGWDTIQITDSSVDAVGYISTQEFAERVRIRFD